MKKITFLLSFIILGTFNMNGYSETKCETLLKKIPQPASSYTQLKAQIPVYENISKELEKELNAVAEKSGMKKEMTQAEAMQLASSSNSFTPDDIKLMTTAQTALQEVTSDYQQFLAGLQNEMSPITEKYNNDKARLDEKYTAEFNTVNDGEGSTKEDERRGNEIRRKYLAAQEILFMEYLNKVRPFIAKKEARLNKLVVKNTALSEKMLQSKNFGITQQGMAIKTNIISNINEYCVELTVLAKTEFQGK